MDNRSQHSKNKHIKLKLKSLNGNSYIILANTQKPILSLQTKIQQITQVPISYQHLLYKGLCLDPSKYLFDYHIEEDNQLQLIANRIPSERSQHSMTLRRDQRIINNTQQYFNNKKHRYLQQRVNGFKLKCGERLQILAQNQFTIKTLIQCLNPNYITDIVPFKFDRRIFATGQWVDIRDCNGHWAQGQIIQQHGQYVSIHYNGFSDRYNQWIPTNSDRIMPFRSYTVQSSQSKYLSPSPNLQCNIKHYNNKLFNPELNQFIIQVKNTLQNLQRLLNQLNYSDNQEQIQYIPNLNSHSNSNQYQQNQKQDQINDIQPQPIKQTQLNYNIVGDNLSNKCQDDLSNKCQNDDISNKSFKSKRSQGLVDTASMKSLIIDENRRKSKNQLIDTFQAQSVCSMKNNNNPKLNHIYNQQYIPEEDSLNSQKHQDYNKNTIIQIRNKMILSQLAPLCDRMGRMLIDLAPQLAMKGHVVQPVNNFCENMSTFTNQGQEERSNGNSNSYCQFQIPIMLTPEEIHRLNRLLETQRRQINQSGL